MADIQNLEDDMLEIENALQANGTASPRGRSWSADLLSQSAQSINKNEDESHHKHKHHHQQQQHPSKPPFLPAGLPNALSNSTINSAASATKTSALLQASKDSKERVDNVFERLHREQTIASQAKMREGSSGYIGGQHPPLFLTHQHSL